MLSWPRPASSWSEAAPVGNGRLGAMVFGGARRARLQLNDATVWSGYPQGPARALEEVLATGAGPGRLAEARRALREGDHRRAEALLLSFEGRYGQEYLPYADLWLDLPEADGAAAFRGRTLNLDDGVAGEEIGLGGGRTVRRLTWASHPARAVCVAVAVRGGTTGMRVELTSPLRVVHREAGASGLALGVEIPVDGAPAHEPDVPEPLRYAAPAPGGHDPFGALAVRVATDGEVSITGDAWTVRGMTYALLVLASSTAAARFWTGREPLTREEHLRLAARDAESAAAAGAGELLRAHRRDLRALLGTTTLVIGDRRAGTYDVARDILAGPDDGLRATVMFQLGRYLLASASRPGAPPANLQGLWNQDLRPAWSSNYTLNINTQMNYWPAEPAGLPGCHEPLFELIDRLSRTGAEVARRLYGARGWVAHHNTDMWGWALPVGMGRGDPSWAIWMMGGVWLARHLWDHYDFGRDPVFLRERAWPVLRGCAEFCLDWLVEAPDGRLDTIPSTSPENLFLSHRREPESLTYSAALDMALIRDLFGTCLEAMRVLGLDDPIGARIAAALPRLRDPGVAPDGRLREWAEDHPEHDPHHRHLSHLAAVHPLGLIDPERTPGLAAAAARSLDARGPAAMGWSLAWKIALRARLRDGDAARELFLHATCPYDAGPASGGLLPNLFSTHPPFQIDGNHGLTAALLELVVQSHGGAIRLLPALPAAWPDGSADGVRCRGGWTAGLAWRDGTLTRATVRNDLPGPPRPVRVHHAGTTTDALVPSGEQIHLSP
ncbi:alpha-L-fucosidase 2 [Thermocatellispora tengchongensis]|uniref:Alpha-L-fucosidase 2 n=1 Tax=Thermocatellispora tengchongensis TaxID=1073253 RepID=A0A840P3W8_9ACTN|nr:glycoside hydrolase N-terminal domain-containing protein [Thermocatellispora tengchongensis]MBB5133679.1 alpha-L-fucosidase 2 [Thermocatellispora tengchongensis]